MNRPEATYRIFISYSHEDRELARELVKILEKNGMIPLWDANFAWGHGFPDQIKNFIAHAHVFVPIITEASSKRGWVHQEIGYAMALHIPVLPVTRDRMPDEMLQGLLAVPYTDDPTLLEKRLSRETIRSLVRSTQGNARPLYECAMYHEERTMMMGQYANKVLELGAHGHVRQKGALSSFHIPDKPLGHDVWIKRYGSFETSEYRYKLLREERKALEIHARAKGCSLIIDPYVGYERYGPEAKRVRLQTLLEFLESMEDNMVRIAVKKEMPREEHITIVGDWFMAESVSAALGKGYRQTIFTRHAPTVQAKIEIFDQELEEILKSTGIKPSASRASAMEMLTDIIKGLG